MKALSVKTVNNRLEVQTEQHGLLIAHFDEIRHIECNNYLMLVQTVNGRHTLIVLDERRKSEIQESVSIVIKAHDSYMFNRKTYAGQFEPAVNYKQSLKEWGVTL